MKNKKKAFISVVAVAIVVVLVILVSKFNMGVPPEEEAVTLEEQPVAEVFATWVLNK